MNSRLILIMFALCASLVAKLEAEVLVWNFSIDEQQIKNGPEPDRSTNSPGTGSGQFTFDTQTNVLSYDINWDGLVGDLTKLHVHGPADENSSTPQHVVEIFGPPAIPTSLATTSGTWSDSIELTTLVQDGFPDLQPSEIIDIMQSGQAYLNVHSTVFGMGEIRGNLGHPVPEPTGVWLVVLASVTSLLAARRIRS